MLSLCSSKHSKKFWKHLINSTNERFTLNVIWVNWPFTKATIHDAWLSSCDIRGAVGPVPDVVPFLDLPGRVPTKGVRFSSVAPAGPVRRLCPRVLLGVQGQLAPWAGLPGEQPAHYLLPTRRKQVLLSVYLLCLDWNFFSLISYF